MKHISIDIFDKTFLPPPIAFTTFFLHLRLFPYIFFSHQCYIFAQIIDEVAIREKPKLPVLLHILSVKHSELKKYSTDGISELTVQL